MADWYPPDSVAANLAARTVEHSEVRIRFGDDPRWAAPEWDDSDWPVVDRNRLPLRAGIFWLRLRVRTRGGEEQVPTLVMMSGGSAHDFHCDGVLVHSSGVPGDSRPEEVDGMATHRFELPPGTTAPGEHVIAVRMSNHHRRALGAEFTRLVLFTVPPERFFALDSKLNMLPAMGAGAMLTIAIAGFVLWLLADRRLILLLFAVLCVHAALLVAVATAPSMWDYPSAWAFPQSLSRVGLVAAVAGLLVSVAVLHFHPARSRLWLLAPVAIEGLIAWRFASLGLPAVLFPLWRVAFAAVLLIAAVAAWRRREGAWWVIAGVAGTALLFERDPRRFDMTQFALGFLPVMVGLIAAIALQLRREGRQARDAKLTAARLEIELLRKNLQPHFLLNTLTTLSQMLEEKPAAAVRLIEDLATEFRALNRLANETQVPLADELALCRAHLRVMSARTERTCSLAAEGVDPAARVPPALFLTLIENGFSHQRVGGGDATFVLRAERIGGRTRYSFLSPGGIVTDANRIAGGTGLRYVRSRLAESFHEGWSFSHREVPGGWETVIELGAGARNGVTA